MMESFETKIQKAVDEKVISNAVFVASRSGSSA